MASAARDRTRDTDEPSLVRRYAGIMGVVIILLGLLGLVAGERQLADAINVDIAEDLVHLVTGGLLAWVGFGQRDNRLAHTVVGALGVVYLLVGILGFLDPELFGLLPHEYTVLDNIAHIVIGLANIAVAWLLNRDRA